MKTYIASNDSNQYLYLGIDADTVPTETVMVLTKGGIQMRGDRNTKDVIAYVHLVKRDRIKEEVQAIPGLTREQRVALVNERKRALIVELATASGITNSAAIAANMEFCEAEGDA